MEASMGNMGAWVSRWEEYETGSRILFPSDCEAQEQIQNSSHLFGVKMQSLQTSRSTLE